MVGDSITYFSSPYVERSLEADWYGIDATTGYWMTQMSPATQQLLPRSSAAWVVELGTNDARYGNGNGFAHLSREVEALRTQRCVVLVTVSPRLGSIATGIDQAAIASTVAGQSNFHSLD